MEVSFWVSQLLMVIVLLIIGKVINFLIISPLRVKAFYEKQGVNCEQWHPFHFLKSLFEGRCHRDDHYSIKKLLAGDRDCKAYLTYDYC